MRPGFGFNRQFGFGQQRPELFIPVPTLDINFLLSDVLDARITASGGANGTRVDATGATVAATTPRFDYNPATLAARGLLVEMARENRFLHSNDPANAAWSKLRATYSGGKLLADATPDTDHSITQTVASAGVDNTFSAKMKDAEFGVVFTQLGGAIIRSFNLSTGAPGSYNLGTSTRSMEAGADGYDRCILTGVSSNSNFNIYMGEGDGSTLDITIAGNRNGEGFFLKEAQLEAGAFPTSYIPTTTAAVTRTADTLTMTGTNFSDWWNAAGGTVVVEADSAASGTCIVWRTDDGTANNRIQVFLSGTTAIARIISGGVTVADLSLGTVAANMPFKVAFGFDANGASASLNGAAPVTDASVTIPTVNVMRLGNDGGLFLNGHLRRKRYWPTRLSNRQLQKLAA